MEPQDQYLQAIKDGDVQRVLDLLKAQPDLAALRLEGGLSPALFAMYYKEPAVAQAIIIAGAPLDVFAAAGCGQLAVLQALLDESPELVNAFAGDGFQPLGLAAFFGQEEAVRLLLERGAQVNSPSNNPLRVTPLHSAAANRHLETCRMLLEAGADANAVQADDFTPLHAAAQNDDPALARLLLAYGADPHAATRDGLTPRDLARREGSTQVLHLL